MSEFLGRQDCIESLRKDLVDLQGAILDVFSRTGPVRSPSWKYPDKASCELDMVALLGEYDFTDGEEAFNQHSHIVLLELLIDRLLLLLQSFSAYVEQMRCSHRRDRTQQRRCLSVGLVVRHYWSNLVQFANQKGMQKDIKTQAKTFDCNEPLSSVSSQMSSKSDILTLSSSSCSSSPSGSAPSCPKADSRSVSCQTIQSSLVPCDACHQVQCALRQTGDGLVGLFQSEGLPSSLRPLSAAVRDTLELGHMTAGDITQWAGEQLRDMRRLAKHLQDVRGTVRPLEERLEVAEAEREKFRFQLERAQREFKQELEKHQVNSVQLEFSLHKAQRSVKETEQRLQEEQRQLKRETLSLEESNCRLREKVAEQQDALQTLQCEKDELQEKVRVLQVQEEDSCCKLQQRIQQLESQVSDTQLRLDKEEAKYHSACRQQESMQAKQESLLKRVDALDEECDELQTQLEEKEERQIELQNQLQQMSEEREQVQAQLAQQQDLCLELQKEKQTLERLTSELRDSVAELKEFVRALKERERLLVAFPELSHLAQAPPQSTGNVFLDMEQQVQANSVRIKLLEQENMMLHNSLVKLRERAQNKASREASPQQSWSLSLPSTPVEKQLNHLTQDHNPLQSGSAARTGHSEEGEKAGRGESGLESAGTEDHVSSAAASPSSLQLHLQTLHFSSDSAAARNHMKTRSTYRLSQSRNTNQRKKT